MYILRSDERFSVPCKAYVIAALILNWKLGFIFV